jgi:hypothetical protein
VGRIANFRRLRFELGRPLPFSCDARFVAGDFSAAAAVSRKASTAYGNASADAGAANNMKVSFSGTPARSPA